MKYLDDNEIKQSGELKLTRSQPHGPQHSSVSTGNQDTGFENSQINGTNGLPRKFVDALKGLFTLLDESKSGLIKLSDLEARWKTIENESSVPKGFIECLQNFQTAHDLIDFERFCHAIAVCISRDNVGNGPSSPRTASSSTSSASSLAISSSIAYSHNNELRGAVSLAGNPGTSNCADLNPSTFINNELIKQSAGIERSISNSEIRIRTNEEPIDSASQDFRRPFSVERLRQENPVGLEPLPPTAFNESHTVTAPMKASCEDICNDDILPDRPTEFKSDYRVKSMPQLQETISQLNCDQPGTTSDSNLPMVSSTAFRQYNSEAKISYDTKNQRLPMRNRIINILKEWKNNVIYKSTPNPPLPPSLNSVSLGPGTSIAPSLASNITATLDKNTNSAQGNSGPMSLSTQPKLIQEDDDWGFSTTNGGTTNVSVRNRHGKRREARRHTVSSGIDINTIKRLQQYEQEKEILLQGLEMIERGRDWYIKSINAIQNKIRFIGQTMVNPGDYSLDANQERINFQAARILTVNQHLAALMDNSRGFPVHMNLALRPILTNPQGRVQFDNRPEALTNVTVQRLKEQNRLLTEEVSMKSEKITILEREKSALIRELFQSRSNPTQKSSDDIEDNTFM